MLTYLAILKVTLHLHFVPEFYKPRFSEKYIFMLNWGTQILNKIQFMLIFFPPK